MKANHLLFALFALLLGAAACENDYFDSQQPSEPKTYTVKLRTTGEVEVTYEPLTRFTPDDRDLYGVQVLHKPATTGSYEFYAYGLFDSLDNAELEVTENHIYWIQVWMVDDGKDKVFCDSILIDQNYYLGYDKPFRGKNKYNGATTESITQLTNQFTYDSDRYFTGINSSGYLHDITASFKAKDGKTYTYPEDVDYYFGTIGNYTPTEDGTTLSIYLKRMAFGLKVVVGDYLDNGKITLTTLGGEHTYTFTPENRVLEKTYSYMSGLNSNDYDWYDNDDLSQTYRNFSLDFLWTKADGTTVDWKPFTAKFYRLKQTVFNLEYYGEDGVLGNNYFEAHYEDTPIEEAYQSYTFGKEQDDYNW